jgi:hypothetical protein
VGAPDTVERDDVRVMFMRAGGDTSPAIQCAWTAFEAAVGLRGRKFFGAFDNRTQEYRVCTLLRAGDDPGALGCEVGTLPGGRYVRARLVGEPPAVYEQIPVAVQALETRGAVDPTRPTIEVYRSRDQIDVLVPVL